MQKTREVIYQVTADKRGYSSCSQERISSLAVNEKETADKQFSVFDLNTLNPQVLFSINLLLVMAVSQHKKQARLLRCRSGNESTPLFLLPPLGDEKELRKSSLNKKKNTRIRKMFIQSVTQVARKKKIRLLATGVLSCYRVTFFYQ